MTITDAFSRLGKLLPVYSKLAAVVLKVENGQFHASGIARGQSFGFYTELKDNTLDDFTITVAPDVLMRALKLNVTEVSYVKGSLKVRGSFGTGDGSPVIEVTCDSVIEALANDVAKLRQKTLDYIAEMKDIPEICTLSKVLKPWQALAKCGTRLFLTEDLSYSASPSANAFYAEKAACQNLPQTEEPLQAESAFVAELTALNQAFSTEEFKIYALNNGTVFLVLSEDKSVYAVEGAPVRLEKNTLGRIQKRLADVGEFDTLTLPQSAVRDVLQTAVEKSDIDIQAENDILSFRSGALVGKIKVDTTDFDCMCGVVREHTSLALSALPVEPEMVLGYGESDGRTFLSFAASNVTIIVPVQDITEV